MLKIRLNRQKLQKIAVDTGSKEARKVADNIYTQSQKDCPEDTGELKASGYVKRTLDGYQVGYKADHAKFVNYMPQSMLKSGKTHFFTSAVEDAREQFEKEKKAREAKK